jgi:hypothetical protein
MSILSNKNVVWVEKSLRYKPDFVINELYCIVFTDERQQRQPNHNTGIMIGFIVVVVRQ